METLIINPKDKAELNFFLELVKRLGVQATIFNEVEDEQLLIAMEENKRTSKTDKQSIIDTLNNILNEDQPPYKNES